MLRVSGRNLDIGDALREHVESRIQAALSRFSDGDPHGHVTVMKDGAAFRTECLLHLPQGLTLQAESRAHDPHASVDQAAERISRRLKRHHHRVRDHRGPSEAAGATEASEAVYTVFAAFDEDVEDGADEGEAAPVVIAEQTARLRPLSVSEAVAELDLTGAPALAFRHAGHGRVNVVYRRPDGHIGWIDVPRPEAA